MDRNTFMGFNDFVWFMGVVENRNDPLNLGRVQVRIFGWHTENKADIPTQDLPWAQPIFPPNIAHASSTLKEGQYVVGFFSDSVSAQAPIIMGSLPGVPDTSPQPGKGFADPRNEQQLQNSPRTPQTVNYSTDGSGVGIEERESASRWPFNLNEPTTSRLYRHENIDDTNVGRRRRTLDKQVPTADPEGLYWDEPYPAYNTTPPYNNVIETESGHLFEMDDTPGSERIHLMHRSGSFVEMYPSGTKVEKVTKNNYEIIMGDDMIHVMGKVNVTVDSDINLLVRGDVNIIGGNDINARIAGSVNITAGENFNVKAQNISLEAYDNIDVIGTTIKETSSNKNMESLVYRETVGESHYRWNGDKYMWTGADTYSRHDSGTNFGCPSDPPRGSGESCPSVDSADGANSPNLNEAPYRTQENKAKLEEEPLPVPNLNVVPVDKLTPEQAQALNDSPQYGVSETSSPTDQQQVEQVANTQPIVANADAACIPIANLSPSEKCLDLIKQSEGFSAKAYKDVYTISIGYGVTAAELGRPLKLGDTVTQQQAEEDLRNVVTKFANSVKGKLTAQCITQGQFDAIVCLAYNIGLGNFGSSTVLRLTNTGDKYGAADAFLLWTKAGGKVLPGLVKRREKERKLYLS
jgi:lysozyme